MRVLLDNCVPKRLAGHLKGHLVQTAVAAGLADLKDGPLLEQIAGRFDVLITVDKSLRHQQRMEGRPFGLIVLRARTNRLPDLEPLVPVLLATLVSITNKTIVEIGHRTTSTN